MIFVLIFVVLLRLNCCPEAIDLQLSVFCQHFKTPSLFRIFSRTSFVLLEFPSVVDEADDDVKEPVADVQHQEEDGVVKKYDTPIGLTVSCL